MESVCACVWCVCACVCYSSLLTIIRIKQEEGTSSKPTPILAAKSKPTPAPQPSKVYSFFSNMFGGKKAPPPDSDAPAPAPDSDEESFSDGELEDGLEADSKPGNISESSRKGKKVKSKEKERAHKVAHQKTDVNVFRLDLSKVAEDGELATGIVTRSCF